MDRANPEGEDSSNCPEVIDFKIASPRRREQTRHFVWIEGFDPANCAQFGENWLNRWQPVEELTQRVIRTFTSFALHRQRPISRLIWCACRKKNENASAASCTMRLGRA